MAPSDTTVDPVDLRTQVVAASIRLFSEYGYESTTVDQIAADAGVSRRTLFRQFRSKEDMIFADHEALIAQVAERLAPTSSRRTNRWTARTVDGRLRRRRDRLHALPRHPGPCRPTASRGHPVPALRDRELVTTYRYQRVFEEFLRRRFPTSRPSASSPSPPR